MVDTLLSNAARQPPPGTPIHVRCWRQGEAAVLAVEDEGPGVPDGYEEIVFEAFRRGPNAEGTPGSGIGLSLVARFAELHAGRAWVERRSGGGGAVRVPAPGGGVPPRAPPRLPLAGAGGPTASPSELDLVREALRVLRLADQALGLGRESEEHLGGRGSREGERSPDRDDRSKLVRGLHSGHPDA